jgi:hypothetical protein
MPARICGSTVAEDTRTIFYNGEDKYRVPFLWRPDASARQPWQNNGMHATLLAKGRPGMLRKALTGPNDHNQRL